MANMEQAGELLDAASSYGHAVGQELHSSGAGPVIVEKHAKTVGNSVFLGHYSARLIDEQFSNQQAVNEIVNRLGYSPEVATETAEAGIRLTNHRRIATDEEAANTREVLALASQLFMDVYSTDSETDETVHEFDDTTLDLLAQVAEAQQRVGQIYVDARDDVIETDSFIAKIVFRRGGGATHHGLAKILANRADTIIPRLLELNRDEELAYILNGLYGAPDDTLTYEQQVADVITERLKDALGTDYKRIERFVAALDDTLV